MTPATAAADIARLAARVPAAPAVAGNAAARKAGEEFEALFLSQMIAHMFAGVGDDPIFGGGEAGRMYRSMMHDEYGKAIAKAGGIGIADSVIREVLKLQGVQAR